jgi:hypothetical protein
LEHNDKDIQISQRLPVPEKAPYYTYLIYSVIGAVNHLFDGSGACSEQVSKEQCVGYITTSLSHALLEPLEGGGAPPIVERLASYLQRTAAEPGSFIDTAAEPFTSVRPPVISIQSYAERLHQYMKCSPVCFVYAYVFMQRLEMASQAKITTATMHRCVQLHFVLERLLSLPWFDNITSRRLTYIYLNATSLSLRR